jgi:hypothetical protein
MECKITQQIHKKFLKITLYMEIGKKPPWAYFRRGVSFCRDTPKLLKPLFNFVYLTLEKNTNGVVCIQNYFEYINIHILKI